MSRDLYESLSDPDDDTHGPEAAWLSQLATAATALRAWKADGLAEAELQEGFWADEDDALEDDAPVSLAASDDAERSFPARYAGGGWQVLVGISADGEPYALLTDGPGDFATLSIGGVSHDLSLGAERPLPDLEAPPERLHLTDEDGATHTLT